MTKQLPSIPMLAIRKLRKRIEQLKTYAHVDTAVTLRKWCLDFGGHNINCARYLAAMDSKSECDCGWDKVHKELTTFSDKFYAEFRKKAS